MATVLAEPFWLTLWTHQHLSEIRTEEALDARRARIDAAYLAGAAMSETTILDTERKAVADQFDRYEHGREAYQDKIAERRAAGLALAARIRQGAVLRDAEVTSG